jgi:hypothetical protein
LAGLALGPFEVDGLDAKSIWLAGMKAEMDEAAGDGKLKL